MPGLAAGQGCSAGHRAAVETPVLDGGDRSDGERLVELGGGHVGQPDGRDLPLPGGANPARPRCPARAPSRQRGGAGKGRSGPPRASAGWSRSARGEPPPSVDWEAVAVAPVASLGRDQRAVVDDFPQRTRDDLLGVRLDAGVACRRARRRRPPPWRPGRRRRPRPTPRHPPSRKANCAVPSPIPSTRRPAISVLLLQASALRSNSSRDGCAAGTGTNTDSAMVAPPVTPGLVPRGAPNGPGGGSSGWTSAGEGALGPVGTAGQRDVVPVGQGR